ncbi:hypothetical protein BQ8794_130046 [Mesorhizobium prunaredense]|uniref:Uncharacterized protein n=1 Tax=Mesorhizobium prunaredense TaxID=1631249 RepID=A0A1R3V0Y7_9HYPH|nr:hypothetical protein BQ8794_130046 [Mesorhizobium prunaredense]
MRPGPEWKRFLLPHPCPGRAPCDAAIACEFKLVPSNRAMDGGVTTAKRPAFFRNSRRACSSGTSLSVFPLEYFPLFINVLQAENNNSNHII